MADLDSRTTLRVLAVDDEPPALAELLYLLRADPRVERAEGAGNATEALRRIGRALESGNDGDDRLDAVFLDINLPGLSGLDTARLLAGFGKPLAIVFVTAHEGFAVRAFDLEAVDYVLKPVRRERLGEAVRRVCELAATRRPTPYDRLVGEPASAERPAVSRPVASERPAVPVPPQTAARPAEEAGPGEPGEPGESAVPVELAVPVEEIEYAEARGDYARLHTATGSHLVRIPLSALEERWREHGFVRIHRRYLVALRAVRELRTDEGVLSVRVGAETLAVSRRNARALRDLLVQRASNGA
ncbi:LytR/AlgR family response regulator transcription factor [Kitasatospora sp. NPDC052896]|uniref:LytR/AlgR family response regulator transcription factor n=1 Tax=Kitasatospora sp. NPDC052896 TaxID=3364061 RepID=UPI0037C599A0